MTHSKNKGAAGERELAAELTRLFGIACRRGQQYSGLEGKDVVGLPGVHIECKRTERLELRAALEQAIEDADAEVPIVCHRASRQPWIVSLRLEDLPALAAVIEHLIGEKADGTRSTESAGELGTPEGGTAERGV